MVGQYNGELAALTAAFLWAAATLLFGRIGRQLSPLVLNLVKGLFAITFILITLTLRTLWTPAVGTSTNSLPLTATIYLLLSGVIGIGLGDTAYFAAINALGARRALLLETLAPPMTTVLAWVFLSEQLPAMAIGGIVITLSGVAWVISERVPVARSKARELSPKQERAGLQIALLALLCQASGAVLSRAALLDIAVDPLWSSLIRLLAGMAFLGGLAGSQPWRLGNYNAPVSELSSEAHLTDAQGVHAASQLATDDGRAEHDALNWQRRWQLSRTALKTPNLLAAVALAALLGTYLGIWLQQIALKYTAAGIAQALLATSPLFVLPMAALLGDRISMRAILGVAIALSGVWLLFL